jgi:hypothetical protein
MQRRTIKQRRRRFSGLILFLLPISVALAADDWIMLKTPRMTLLSQASEKRTRAWASEFNQFIDALRVIFPLNEELLPPLTVVLFKQSRDYRDYQMRTESGAVEDNVGVFINRDTWSVMSLSSTHRFADIDKVTYHEAVHWFMAADPTEYPLWFDEGMAEVLSTYEVDDDVVRWGVPIRENVGLLRYTGVQPMERFLRSSQDAAMHGDTRFYPQAWAFVHYLMFGKQGGQEQLQALLKGTRESGLTTAFRSTFNMEFDEFGADLEEYLDSGRYGTASVPLDEIPSTSSEFVFETADPVTLALGLSRLSLGTGNAELAQGHVEELRASAPDEPATWDTEAAVAALSGNETALTAALDRAIELGSRDAFTWTLQAARLWDAYAAGETTPPDERFTPQEAREIANALTIAIDSQPFNLPHFHSLVGVFMSLDQFTETDRFLIDYPREFFTDEAVFDVGRAIIAHKEGRTQEAVDAVGAALGGSKHFSRELHATAEYLHRDWIMSDLLERVDDLRISGDYLSALVQIDQQLAMHSSDRVLVRSLEGVRGFVVEEQKFMLAREAGFEGRRDEQRAILQELIDNPDTSNFARRNARDMIDEIN